MQDEIVGWVQGLAAHIDKYDQAQKAARRPMRHRRQRTGAAEQVTALCRAIHSWLGCIWRLVEGVAAMMMFVSRIVASVPASHTPRPPPPVVHPSYPFAADCATLLSG
jgi:hypothetical protein